MNSEVRAMKSGTSFFNWPLFRKTVLRFWPIWAIYAVALLAQGPFRLAGWLRGAQDAVEAARFAQQVPALAATELAVFFVPASCVAAGMAVYSHLYFARSAAAYGALPIKRGAIFNSVTLAGLLPILALNILAGLACLLAGAGQFRAVLPAAAGMAAALCLVVLCYFGIASLCAQLTGSIIALPILFFTVCVASELLDELIVAALSDFAYGYAGNSGGALSLFSPIMGISRYLRTEGVGSVLQDGVYSAAGYRLSGWGCLLGYAAAGLLLLWPAQALYKRRRLESAGEVVAVGVLRPVFRYILAAGGALVLACFLSWGLNLGLDQLGALGAAVFSALMLLGGFIGWSAAEMLMRKSFRVFKMGRAWLGLGVLWALLTCLLFVVELDATGFERRVPAADEVRSVGVSTYTTGGQMLLREPENVELAIELHQRLVDEKGLYEAARRDDPGSYDWETVTFIYSLGDGSRMQRKYKLSGGVSGADIELLQTIANIPEGLLSRKLPDAVPSAQNIAYASVSWAVPDGDDISIESFELTPEEAAELYRLCILPDMQEAKIGLIWFTGGEASEAYDCCISMELIKDARHEGGFSAGFYTYATVYSERTNAWLEAHGVELRTPEQLGNEHLQS